MKIRRFVKEILPAFIPQYALKQVRDFRQRKLLNQWQKDGCPAPPPHLVKARAIAEYRRKYQYTTLIETGTFLGDMVEAQKHRFNRIISIELGYDLYIKAKSRFENDLNITIVQGDSGKVLPKVLADINEPAIFWLDGHYSAGITAKGDKDCPIFEELDSIFSHKKLDHILLIDDARCFVGEGDYPTIEKLTDYIKEKNEFYHVEVKHDIIRCVVKNVGD